MADTFHIACMDCKEHLWIGQSCWTEKSGLILYHGGKESEKQSGFFMDHINHSLKFVRTDSDDIHDEGWSERE